MYTCVYIYIHTYIYIYVYTYRYGCVYIYIINKGFSSLRILTMMICCILHWHWCLQPFLCHTIQTTAAPGCCWHWPPTSGPCQVEQPFHFDEFSEVQMVNYSDVDDKHFPSGSWEVFQVDHCPLLGHDAVVGSSWDPTWSKLGFDSPMTKLGCCRYNMHCIAIDRIHIISPRCCFSWFPAFHELALNINHNWI